MNANGQPFNVLKNPLAAFLTRVVGKGKQINTHPIHDASGEAPNPVGVSTGFKGFWAFDGTTDEVQHLSGLGVLVSDEPKGFPLLGYGGVGHFSPQRWIWADGDDGSEAFRNLEDSSFRYFLWNGDFQNNSRSHELSRTQFENYRAMSEGAPRPDDWPEGQDWDWEKVSKPWCDEWGCGPNDIVVLQWRIQKNYFRHVCDRLLIAQNCYLEASDEQTVVLKHVNDLHWHAPQLHSLPPAYGKTRGWTGPACDIEMPWKSKAERLAKETAEKYNEDESDGEDSDSDSDSGDMGTIQFHTLRYLDFIPLAIHQHPMSSAEDAGHIPSYVHANPGKRQAYAEEIIEEYQTRVRNKLPRAWGIPKNVPIYKIQFKTPRETDGEHAGEFKNEWVWPANEQAVAAVEAGVGIKILYWNEVPMDNNTKESTDAIFGECRLGYYWDTYEADGWEAFAPWYYKDTNGGRNWNRRKPMGRWVPYDNVVNKLFYAGPFPVEWNEDWGRKVNGKWPEEGDQFIHGNSQNESFITHMEGEAGEGVPLQDHLCIPLGAAFDLMAIVEVWRFAKYVMVDQSDIPDYWRVVDETGDDVYGPDDEDEGAFEDERTHVWRKRWRLVLDGNFYRRIGLQSRIVKPIPPEGADEEGGE